MTGDLSSSRLVECWTGFWIRVPRWASPWLSVKQVQRQLDVFRWNNPTASLEHLYVTPTPATQSPTLGKAMAYVNRSWPEFAEPLLQPFGDNDAAAAIRRFVHVADEHRWWN